MKITKETLAFPGNVFQHNFCDGNFYMVVLINKKLCLLNMNTGVILSETFTKYKKYKTKLIDLLGLCEKDEILGEYLQYWSKKV